MFAVVDCGTTNTRVYILDESGKVAGRDSQPAGVRDTVATGSTERLRTGIRAAFSGAAAQAGVGLEDIEFAVAAGMITSDIGLIDLTHLVAPAGLAELAAGVVRPETPDAFPVPIPVLYVRGVKNPARGESPFDALRGMDFMRGEEVQMMGLLSYLTPQLPVNVIVLSSHTKLIHLDAAGRIAGSMTTISGQFYDAVQHTSIAKALQADSGEGTVQPEAAEKIMEAARAAVDNSGLLRTMLMPRFLHTLVKSTAAERRLFAQAAIAADDMRAVTDFGRLGFDIETNFVLVGQAERCAIYERFLARVLSPGKKVHSISDQREVDLLAVRGAWMLAQACREPVDGAETPRGLVIE